MLINPSPLLGLRPARTRYSPAVPTTRDCYRVICDHCSPKMPCQFMGGQAVIQINYVTVDMTSERFNKEGRSCRIWHGCCRRCLTWYWACDTFDWVAWLTDLQVTRMVLGGIPIRHVELEGKAPGQSAFIVTDRTAAYFWGGKVEEVR